MSGCSALTGRPFIQWSDDKAIQTRVKTRLATVSLKHLSRVNVDVYDGTVYLTGIVDSAEARQRAEAAATAVEGVRQVVSHLIATHGDAEPVPSALPRDVVAPPVPEPLIGIAKLEGTRAYDSAGRHVATVHAVPMSELAHAVAERFSAAGPIEHVTIHAMTATAEMPVPHYLIVLWHVSDPQAAPYTRVR